MGGVRTRTVTTPDGAGLAVQVGGPDDAPVLLLLPGQANSHRWWDGLRERFEGRFRTVTFDYRGTGATVSGEDDLPGPRRGWTTASFAADARCVLDALGCERALVHGTSMGGRVAQMLALDSPERVERMVLACTSPGGPHAVERSQDVRRALAQPDPEARRRATFELFYTPAWPGRPEESNLLGDPTMTPDAARAHLRVSARHDAWDGLPRITTPTLVLHGTEDLMTPAVNAELLAARLPHATLRLHPRARHGFFEELADEVTAEVVDFLG